MFTRPPPPQGAPPPYAFVSRVYRRSLRPVVIGITLVSGVWALIWGVASFRDLSVDKDHASRLQVFDIVLGVLYMSAVAIELLGLAASLMQKLALIRIYAFLSLGAAVVVTATMLIRVVIHFVFKNDLIQECIALAQGETVTTRFGIWGPTTTHTLDLGDATDFCNSAWSHDSFSEIAWFIVVAIISVLFASIAFSYYRQMLDPTSPANAARAPSAQARAAGMYPQHYNPPYAADGSGAYGASRFAPPPGPPPGARSEVYVPEYDPAKLPDYEVGGYGSNVDDKKGNDPFADFDGQTKDTDRDVSGDAARRV